MRRKRGIDVSKWEGRIDWREAARDDVHFAMIRVGYGSPEGDAVRDSYFRENIRRALKHGVHTGIYFYTYAQSVPAAHREAEWVIRELEPYSGRLTYPVAFDIEDTSLENLGRSKNTDMVREFCNTLRDAGYYAMYYTYLSFLGEFLEYERLTDYDLWLADYTEEANSQYRYGMWQYSDEGRIRGIRGHTDLDISFRDYPSIIKKAHLNGFHSPEESQKHR